MDPGFFGLSDIFFDGSNLKDRAIVGNSAFLG